jgi:putative hemolysin
MEKKKFIDIRSLIKSKNPRLLKWLPNFVIKYLERILHQDEINEFLENHPDDKGVDFCSSVIKDFNITTSIKGLENIPKSGGLVLAMNHPLGGMDAIALVDALKDIRPDVKFIVNDILLSLEPMKELFVGVNKHGKNSLKGLKDIDQLFSSGNLVCIFPAGLVSRKTNGIVQDLEWKKTFVNLARKNNIPILPVHINGQLSNFFYRLSNFRTKLGIKANIEMLYLSDELHKQKNAQMTFTIGELIPVETLDKSKSPKAWAEEIRKKVYQLAK